MKHIANIIVIILLFGCNSSNRDKDHTEEFNQIDRYDIAAYEEFIEQYPNSSHVSDAKERIDVAKQAAERERLAEEQRTLETLYGSNSLNNGDAPYEQWYGSNKYYSDNTPHSEISVKAPYNSDVIVIVRYNNHNGEVAGHKYVKAGCTATIYLKNAQNYQTFFYYGTGWHPDKVMKNGVRGGFIKNEAFSKDGAPVYLYNNALTYELTLTSYGNFNTSGSNENEIF